MLSNDTFLFQMAVDTMSAVLAWLRHRLELGIGLASKPQGQRERGEG